MLKSGRSLIGLSAALRRDSLLVAIPFLFFLSGATGLSYQVVWLRRFGYIWGSSSFAMAAVVAAFLAGLGLGAYVSGRASRRWGNPLLLYGVCELGVAGLAILLNYEIPLLYRLAQLSVGVFGHSTAALFVVRILLTFLCIGPPCFLMGATLPLLVRALTNHLSPKNEAVGYLYGLNTAGAALGCVATGFYLLPIFGLYVTNNLMVVTNAVIGVVAISLAGFLPAAEAPEDDLATQSSSPSRGGFSLYLVAFLAGAGALVLEMVWARQLCLLVGGSTYAFSAVLTVYLIGLGIGGGIFHLWARRWEEIPNLLPSAVVVVIVGSTLAGLLTVAPLARAIGLLIPMRTSYTSNAAICLLASSALEMIPAIAMGFYFPLLVHIAKRTRSDWGRAAGDIYGANTLGSILGASLTASLVFPILGTANALGLGLLFYVISLLLITQLERWRDYGTLTATCALGCLSFFVLTQDTNPWALNAGRYMYGELGNPEQLLFFEEGVSCNVLVIQDRGQDSLPQRSLRVNGKIDASDCGDMKTQLGCAYMPLFLRPQSEEILVIGFGSGVTTGACLSFPETRVTCCEIEPAVVAAGEFFAHVNSSPTESPRCSIVYDDARSYLNFTDKNFDIVISEPSNPWVAGVGKLFTREFYQSAKLKLNDQGVLVQWVQEYAFTTEQYSLVLRTLKAEFSHQALIRISGGDTLLIASEHSLFPDAKQLDAVQSTVNSLHLVKEQLERYFDTADVRSILLERYLFDEIGVARAAEMYSDDTLITDINMRLEFDAPLSLFQAGNGSRDEVNRAIISVCESRWFEQCFSRWECTPTHVAALHDVADLMSLSEREDVERQLARFILALDSNDPRALVVVARNRASYETWQKQLALLAQKHAGEANSLGVRFWKEKDLDAARGVFEQLVTFHSESVTAWTNLAVVYQDMGDTKRARSAFDRAKQLDPAFDFLLATLVEFERQVEVAALVKGDGDRDE